MDAPTVASKPCCVCAAPDGKHCTKCKSRHYCSKACQLVDWKRGHKAQCKLLAADFQDRLLDALMPEKKPKEEPAIVEDVLLADGSKARLSAARAAEASAPSDGAPSWLGTCAICLDVLPIKGDQQTFSCCCKRLCLACNVKCLDHDERCPLCRAPGPNSADEFLRRVQKHVDKGNAEAQTVLGDVYRVGTLGLKKSWEQAVQLYERAAAQGHAIAQVQLGSCLELGAGVKIDHQAAAQWYRRAAEQGFHQAQFNLGMLFYHGDGVAQSRDEAVKWYRLAAAQGYPQALFNLGVLYASGQGVPRDFDEALRFFKRAAANEHAGAAAEADKLEAWLAARSGRQA